MLDIRVTTFLTVCQTLNFTRASELLNLTQPAVSQHMAYLEKHYGVKLVDFDGRRMFLTEEGVMLQRAFQSFVHDEMLLEKQLAQSTQHQVAQLSIGTTLTAGEYIVAPALARVLQADPSLGFHIVSKCSEELLSLLAQGTLDCAFIEGIFDKQHLKWDVLCTERLVCICAPENPLAQGVWCLEDICSTPLIVREPESGSRAVLENALRGHNLSLGSFGRITEASSINIIKTFVSYDLGISFVYEAAITDELERGTLACVQLQDFQVEHEICFVRTSGSVFEDTFADLFQRTKREFTRVPSRKTS